MVGRLLTLTLLVLLAMPGVCQAQWGARRGSPDCSSGNCGTTPGQFGRGLTEYEQYAKGGPHQSQRQSRSSQSGVVRDQTNWPMICRVGGASGVLVAKSDTEAVVLTAGHMEPYVRGGCTVTFPTVGESFQGQLESVDQQNDVASIVLSGVPSVRTIDIAEKVPGKGDKLTLVGYGLGNFRAVGTRCKGTGYLSGAGRQRHVSMSVERSRNNCVIAAYPSHSGDSGGAILDAQGKLCGILSSTGGGETVCMTGPPGGRCGLLRRMFSRFRERMQQIRDRRFELKKERAKVRQQPGSQSSAQIDVDVQPPTLPIPDEDQTGLPVQPGDQDAPVVDGSGQCPDNCPGIDYDKLVTQLKSDPEFLEKVRGEQGSPGERGPKGEQGVAGEPGPPGEQGPSGQVTEEQLTAIVNSIYEKMQDDERFRGPRGPSGGSVNVPELVDTLRHELPGITVRTITDDGQVIDSENIPLGGTLNIYNGLLGPDDPLPQIQSQ